MRQLLSRKSKQRMSEDQEPPTSTPAANLPTTEIPNERVFPRRIPNHNGEHLGLFPNVKSGPLKVDNKPADYSNLLPPRVEDLLRPPSVNKGEVGAVEQRKVSERSQYLVASKTGPPRVLIANLVSDKATYRRCEDEPIHTPGTIQNFGALLVLKLDDQGHLEVRVASENSRKVLGYGPEQLFALTSFLDILKDDFQDEFTTRVNYCLNDIDATQEETRLDVFQMVLTFPLEPETRLWCAMHLSPYPENVVVCEFEEYSDTTYFRDIDAARIVPITPYNFIDADITSEDFAKSTRSSSKPLPVFQIARQRANKEFSSMDLFNAMSQSEKQIAKCKTVQTLLEVMVGIVSELTGLHRVMFYRFDAQMNGCVDAELLNPKASIDVFRGMHFPASDIPIQARKLYLINRIRLLHDREATTARLVCRNEKEFEKPLDLTHSYLRAMSPIHNKYLANIGVRSTMSISIVINQELWGLIACHGYGDGGVRISLPIRELCRNLGECAAVNIQRILMQERISMRRAPILAPPNHLATALDTTSSNDLLRLVDADFALFSIGKTSRAIGKPDAQREAEAVMTYLQSCRYTNIKSSSNIKADFPGLSYPAGIKTIAGLLFIPLNVGDGNDFLVFFRKAQKKDVNWAGNPYKKSYKPGSEYLDPRSSFARWTETIDGVSKVWNEDQLDTAAVLGIMYDRFIEMMPHASIGNRRLSSIRTSSEKIRPTLGAIVTHLETALEYSSDEKLREILVKAEKSSTSLMHIVDNLAKLTEIGESSINPSVESFNLSITASQVMAELQVEAQRKHLELNVFVQPNLPAMVKGDGDRFKRLLVYFTDNAFKISDSAKVEISVVTVGSVSSSTVVIIVQDFGPSKTEEELDSIFREFEEAQDLNNWPLSKESSLSSSNNTDGSTSFDLAAVARFVRDVNGQIRVSSTPGKGTTFTVELTYEVITSVPKSRKIRNLFTPSSSVPRGPLPSLPSPLRSPKPEMQAMRDGPDHTNGWPRTNPQPIERSRSPRPRPAEQVISTYSSTKNGTTASHPSMDSEGLPPQINMHVLVAESDPKTLRALDERLSQYGHTVDIASGGQDAHAQFVANPLKIDVILMDLDMPFVDGTIATRMIRFSEKEPKRSQLGSRTPPSLTNRVTIIAMSSSVRENDRFDYIQTGFDGWILKPIDFSRLEIILQGAKNPVLRRDTLYSPGQWEKGGWFTP